MPDSESSKSSNRHNFPEWHNGEAIHFSEKGRDRAAEEPATNRDRVMPSLPKSALVRGYVLNSLENGPARVADLVQRGHAEFGFSHGEIEAAAQHFAVVTQVKKGKIYWMRPANLIAIWWGLDRIPNHIRRTAAQR